MTLVDRVKLHAQGPEISRMIYGTWRMGDAADASTYSPKSIAARIEHCLRLGVTTFDLADIYGGGDHQCERLFGAGLALLEPSTRARIELVAKCDIQLVCPDRPGTYVKHYDTSAAYLTRSVDESLAAVGTTYFDVLLLHRPDPLMDADEVAATLTALKNTGKVRHFGVSNFSPSQVDLLQSRLAFPLVTNQIEVNVLHMEPLHDGTLDHCQTHRMKPMAWSPLAGGRIFDDNSTDERVIRVRAALKKVGKEIDAALEQVAIAWLLTHPSGMLPIIGSNDLKRIETMTAAHTMKLTRQQWFFIWEASAGHEVA